MKIIIEYDFCWWNFFLGGLNNELVFKECRVFFGFMMNFKKEGNFKYCEIMLDIVMGVLNCLIGD